MVCAAGLLLVGTALAGVEMRVEPGRERLRPYETAAILIRFTGSDAALGSSLPPATLHLADRNGGWLSRPFRYEPANDGTARTVAVLYTAPERAGRYVVEGRFKAVPLQVEIAVTPSAPSYRSGESVSFGPESQPRDFYRDLAEHYAPFIAQETWLEPKADFLARFDYDGDWRGDNNWDNLARGTSQAYVYYAAMETATHYFLLYNFFHPRHYSDDCSSGGCYENDSAGVRLTVRKDGSRYGRLQLMEAAGDNQVSCYSLDPRIRDAAQRVGGELKLWHDSHPVVFIEAGTHGVSSAADAQRSRFSADRLEFVGSTGVTYRFGSPAARPRHANDREVSYELLNAAEHWWPRGTSPRGREARTFDEYFRYSPLGNRPRATAAEIAGVFSGGKYSGSRGRPFWSWQDGGMLARKLLAPGQWALDPAYALWVSVRFPSAGAFSLDYIFNPYLEGRAAGAVAALPAPRALATPAAAAPPPAAAPAPPAGDRQVLPPPADKPSYKPKDKHGQLEFRARVDGTVYLHIRGDQIEVEYLSGRPMDEIRYRFSQPIPGEELDEVKLEDVEGRGSVRLLEWPNSGNRFTAKIRIQDDKPGASSYRFKLLWKR